MPTKKSKSALSIEQPSGDLAFAPSALSGKTALESDVIRWVANNIDDPGASAESCPSPIAWTLLRMCRSDIDFLCTFINQIWTKLLPSRSQVDDSDARGKSGLDGKATMELIVKIRNLRDTSERVTNCGVEQPVARLAHAQEVEGSIPSPATTTNTASNLHPCFDADDHDGFADEFDDPGGLD